MPPLLGILTDIAAQDDSVRMPGIDHLHRFAKILGGMRRVRLAQVSVAELSDVDLRRGELRHYHHRKEEKQREKKKGGFPQAIKNTQSCDFHVQWEAYSSREVVRRTICGG